MFNVTVTAATKETIVRAVPEGRNYSLDMPGSKRKILLWTKADKPHLDDATDPADATHHVMASVVNLTELAALALACLDELHRFEYFANDSNGPPPVQCAADVRAYISRQLVIAHNQAAANEADKAANPPATTPDDWYLAHEDWAGPF